MDLKDYTILPRSDGSEILVAQKRSHGRETWDQAYFGLLKENSSMPTIRDFVDRLNHLQSGNVCNGNRERVEASDILADILEKREPYRAEWLDARFRTYQSAMHVIYHKMDKGKREEIFEPLDDCLMEDRQIDLEYWLVNATPQGLPPKDTPKGKLYYYPPRAGAVARFDAYSVGVGLDCNGDHQYSDAGLGVVAQKFLK